MIREINTYRLWEISCLLYNSIPDDEHNQFNYPWLTYEGFLETYNFSIYADGIWYGFSKPMPYEDFNIEEDNWIPWEVYNGTDDEIRHYAQAAYNKNKEEAEQWVPNTIKRKEEEIAELQRQIKELKKQL